MRSGFLAGLLSGGVVSGAVLGAVSVLTGPPGDSAPQAVPLEVPAGSEFDQSREDTEASLPTLQEPLAPDDVPQVEAPEPDDLSSLSGVDTEPAAAPQTGEAQGTLEAPEAQDSGSGIALQS
ncbi:MAG: divergent polysaccharide deacetylase family protein, partial [Rhodobacteraceae bacterium]|nr:divergent polysaccharide deacetylase family protein [Paracoccaceae bacterium]